MNFIPWPDIEAFYNIRKFLSAYPETLAGQKTLVYKSKVKLDGTNAAVQLFSNQVVAQSRSKIISTTDDNMGFAKWVESNKEAWLKAFKHDVIVFGEWVGKGVQSRTAISNIPNKVFVVFAAQLLGQDDSFIDDPEVLKSFVQGLSDAYVLPWYSEVSIDWLAPAEELQKTADSINQMVATVEQCDPFVKDIFGIEGLGEGLVFYPVTSGRTAFNNLVFKAKGEKHKVVNNKAPAQIDPEKAANAEAFANLVLTEARLEQGATVVAGELSFDMKHIGKFIGWVGKDVMKETSAELEASGLHWSVVSRTISDRARDWYVKKVKSL